jgi:hypothetical protein
MPLLLQANSPRSKTVSALGIVVSRSLAQWFARLWITVVIAGSLLPGSASVHFHASENETAQVRQRANLAHRFIHFVAFGSSFLVLSLLATGRREELEAAFEVMAIGCIIELIQYLVYSHRQVFEWWDVRDDAIGIIAGFLLIQIMGQVKRPRPARGLPR